VASGVSLTLPIGHATRPWPADTPRTIGAFLAEERKVTIPDPCERLFNGRPVTVVLADLNVPRCENCGELIFDYDADQQIARAYELQTRALAGSKDGLRQTVRRRPMSEASPPTPAG
jgi:hypothetical protein